MILLNAIFLGLLIHFVSGIYEDAPGIAMDYKVSSTTIKESKDAFIKYSLNVSYIPNPEP
jgi:hypothetical protein